MIAKTKTRVRCCRECSTPLTGPASPKSNSTTRASRSTIFCTNVCKTAWNNRRKNRGADIYDLWMAMRYERDEAKRLGVWAEMCRLSEQWNTEDMAAGHKTYGPPADVVARLKDRGAIRRGPLYRV